MHIHHLSLSLGHIMRMDDNTDAKRILLVPLRQPGEDNQVVPASHGSAPSNRIWNNTTLRSPKQQLWLRTDRLLWRMMSTYGKNDEDDNCPFSLAYFICFWNICDRNDTFSCHWTEPMCLLYVAAEIHRHTLHWTRGNKRHTSLRSRLLLTSLTLSHQIWQVNWSYVAGSSNSFTVISNSFTVICNSFTVCLCLYIARRHMPLHIASAEAAWWAGPVHDPWPRGVTSVQWVTLSFAKT